MKTIKLDANTGMPKELQKMKKASEIFERNIERGCGSCDWMDFEDIDGYGNCSFWSEETHCGDFCENYKEEIDE